MKIMKTPRSVDLDITSRCNLRCSYCYHFTSAGDVDEDLPADEWLRFFEELGRCGVMRVCLAGGEPFLRQDLELLIEGIVRNRMRFTLLTNGTLITGERAAFIARTRRCDSIQVSIDGATPATHESCRDKGSFCKALEGIDILSRSGIRVAVRVTIHRYNVDSLKEIAHFLLVELGLSDFSTNAASAMGLCRANGDAVQLTTQQRRQAMEVLVALNRTYKGRIRASAGPLAEARLWKGMEEARRKGVKGSDGCGYLSACGGVMNKMAVRADGVMIPCRLLSHIELGRINEVSLSRVWQNHPEMHRLRKLSGIPLSDLPFCAGCEYMAHCRGDCPVLFPGRKTDKGSHPSGYCYRQFLQEGGRLPAICP